MSVQEVAAALCHYLPCFSDPHQVLTCRVDVTMWLIHGYTAFVARQKRESPKGRSAGDDRDGTWSDLGGGKRKFHIGSMETLYSVVRGRGGVL